MGNSSPNEQYGLRIYRIADGSPASSTDLQPYTDFIVDVLEKPAKFSLENDFYKFIIQHEDKIIHLQVYNVLAKETRVIQFIPSRDWPNADFLLGFKVRHESITAAFENIYRITGLKNTSLTGKLHSRDDFFIAVHEFIYRDLNQLREKLKLYRRLEIAVYNLKQARVRVVDIELVPMQGIGFEIASGYLHDLSFIIKNSQKSLPDGQNISFESSNNERSRIFDQPKSEIKMQDSKQTGLSKEGGHLGNGLSNSHGRLEEVTIEPVEL